MVSKGVHSISGDKYVFNKSSINAELPRRKIREIACHFSPFYEKKDEITSAEGLGAIPPLTDMLGLSLTVRRVEVTSGP